MVKVPLQNKKDWASFKCLVRKSEKMCVTKPCFTYMKVYKEITHFQVVKSQKVIAVTCNIEKLT